MTKEEINKRIELFKYLFYASSELNSNEVKVDIDVEFFKDRIESLNWTFDCKVITEPETRPIMNEIKKINNGICKFFSYYDFDSSLKIIKGSDKKYKDSLVGNMNYRLDTEELTIMIEWFYIID